MIYQKELDQILNAVESFGEAVFGLADMVHWHNDALDYFVEQEILKSTKPATEAECDGCGEGCVEKVVFADGNQPGNSRAYIACKVHEDMGLIAVDMKMLKRWKANKDRLKELGYPTGYEVLWDPDNVLYISLKDAANMASSDLLTLRRLSRLLEDPGFPVHRMHKGRRCKVHTPEFRKWLEYTQFGISDAAIDKYLEGTKVRLEEEEKKKVPPRD
ncbi:MAG: hypothetical protein FVQ82_13990 [Planctomycetes bacterium]|nr:hypothetical protein [Planctomycetota bacterium]